MLRDLQAQIDACRLDLGDSITGVKGKNCRPPGSAADPRPLAPFEENYPYYMAMYDSPDGG